MTRRDAVRFFLASSLSLTALLAAASCGGGSKTDPSPGPTPTPTPSSAPPRPVPNAVLVRMVFAPAPASRDVVPGVTAVTVVVDVFEDATKQTRNLGRQVLTRPAAGGEVTSAPFPLPGHGTVTITATGAVPNAAAPPVGTMVIDTKNAAQLPDSGLVTFTDDDQDVASVELQELDPADNGSKQLVKGDSRTLSPLARTSKGAIVLSPHSVAFSTSDASVASVGADGRLEAVGAGTASVSVSVNGRGGAGAKRAQALNYTVVTPGSPSGYDDWVPVPVGEGGTTPGMAGFGYDLLSGQPKRTVSVFANPIGRGEGVEETFFESRIRGSSAAYLSDTAMNFRARLSYWGFKLSSSFRLERFEAHAEDSLSVEINVVKRFQPDYVEGAGKWDPEALELWKNDRASFAQRYGTHAIIGRQRALKAAIRINISNVSREEKRLIEASLNLRHKLGEVGGNFHQAIQSALRSNNSVIQISSSGQNFPDIQVPTSLDGIDAWAAQAYDRLSATAADGADETYWMVPYSSLKGGLVPDEDYTRQLVGRTLYEKFVAADLNANALETITAGFGGRYAWIPAAQRPALLAELAKAKDALTRVETLYRTLADPSAPPLDFATVDAVYDGRSVPWPKPEIRSVGSNDEAFPQLAAHVGARFTLTGGRFGRIKISAQRRSGSWAEVAGGVVSEHSYDLLTGWVPISPPAAHPQLPPGSGLWQERIESSSLAYRRSTSEASYEYMAVILLFPQAVPKTVYKPAYVRVSAYGPEDDNTPVVTKDLEIF